MTPEAWASLGSLVQQYGLPLAILAGFGWLILTRKLVTGGELADKQAESDGWKALYVQERSDRIAAQQLTEKRGEAAAEVAEAVASGFENVLKRLPDPYDERLEGRRRVR
jgi:hypothetical protein